MGERDMTETLGELCHRIWRHAPKTTKEAFEAAAQAVADEATADLKTQLAAAEARAERAEAAFEEMKEIMEPLISVASSHAMQTVDRSGRIGRLIESARTALKEQGGE
jgi:hypothetical protein